MTWLLLLLACSTPDPGEKLGAADVDDRRYAFYELDREGLRRHVDTLIRMSYDEPDPELREEVIRTLGYTQDPRVLPVLEEHLATDMATRAAESLGFYGPPEGCDRLADLWEERKAFKERYVPPPQDARASYRNLDGAVGEAGLCFDYWIPRVQAHPERWYRVSCNDWVPSCRRLKAAIAETRTP